MLFARDDFKNQPEGVRNRRIDEYFSTLGLARLARRGLFFLGAQQRAQNIGDEILALLL
jgi:hypothetical protein